MVSPSPQQKRERHTELKEVRRIDCNKKQKRKHIIVVAATTKRFLIRRIDMMKSIQRIG